jgi:hypothetical protein
MRRGDEGGGGLKPFFNRILSNRKKSIEPFSVFFPNKFSIRAFNESSKQKIKEKNIFVNLICNKSSKYFLCINRIIPETGILIPTRFFQLHLSK